METVLLVLSCLQAYLYLQVKRFRLKNGTESDSILELSQEEPLFQVLRMWFSTEIHAC